MKLRRFCTCLFVLFVSHISYSQQFSAFPPSVKWYQINTDTVTIIFPLAVDSQAQRIATIIHRMAKENYNPLGNNLRKIDIVLHNNTTIANGYVSLSPFRSEYYLVPPSNIFSTGANPWEEEFPPHEYRHVQQIANFRNGLSKFASYILGQDGQGLMNVIAIPDYFYEGDAVHSESSLTPQGRGRLPYFFNGFNALWREQRNYSWMKLRNGSLKDYVPDHYELGYLLVNYGYLKYGPDFWGKVTRDATAFKGLIYPFQKAIEKYTGVDYKTFRQQALDYYKHDVSKKRTDIVARETVSNYYFPQYISEDSLLYVRDSYSSLAAFYIKDRSGEHKLHLRNITTENWFSYRNGLVAYTGYNVNARWNLVDYSDIYLYNIYTGNQQKITKKAKYFTPDISPSGNNIIAVSVNDSIGSELHLLQMDGTLVKTFLPAHHAFFYNPRFIDNRSVVVAERLPSSTMTLNRIDIATGKNEELIAPIHATIGYPYAFGNSIYFICNAAGGDDIYEYSLTEKKVYQLGAGLAGRYFPSVYKDKLTWSRFTSNGLRVKDSVLAEVKRRDVTQNFTSRVYTLPYQVAGMDSLPDILHTRTRSFAVTPYKQSEHLFYFHSWRPDYTDPELTVSLFSDNILNTFSNEIFYRHNRNEASNALGFTSYFGSFFPLLDAGATYTYHRTLRSTTRTLILNEAEARVGFSIPLNFTQGKTYKFFDYGTDLVFDRLMPAGIYKDSFATRNRNYLHHFVTWSHYLPMAVQHIYPKLGYTLSVNLRHFINGDRFKFNSQWLLGAQVFLPSIKNHSIVLSGAYQSVDTMSQFFSNNFSNARGYDDYYFRKMWRASVNYHFPICYPDWGFGNIIFFQRVRANIFYDYSKVYAGYFGHPPSISWNLNSTGAEIYFDTKVWNELPVSFGIRISHLLNDDFSGNRAGTNVFEFIVPVNIVPSH